jgi:hypothetical protein
MKPSLRQLAAAASAFGALAGLLAFRQGALTWGQEELSSMPAAVARAFATSTPLPAPLYTPSLLAYALLGAACLLVLAKLGALLWRAAGVFAELVRQRRPLGERGQAMTEVAVSFPVLLVTTLILMQLALMFQAKNVVTYAAFAAARAAIVWIPAEAGGDGKHEINVGGGQKWDKIQQAAAMACIPISPKVTTILGPIGSPIDSVLNSTLGALGVPGEYVENALLRFGYSYFATQVTLYKATENGFEEVSGNATWDYPGGPDVGVEVKHYYYLPIPLVNRILGENWASGDDAVILSFVLPGQYTSIRSVAVLPLEGETGNPPITGFWD